MKLDALEKAVATTREQARILEHKAKQSGQAAQSAKNKARQAKSRLKLIRQEAKQARKASKDAKRTFAEALGAAKTAAAEVANLERNLQKARKKAQLAGSKNAKTKTTVAPKSAAAKLRSHAPKSVAAKTPVKPVALAKPAPRPNLKRAQPAPERRDSGIQVPRDFGPMATETSAATPSRSDASTSPGASSGK